MTEDRFMKFSPTNLAGALLIDPEVHRDERGSFTRTFCQREFADHGLTSTFVQCSVSFNTRAGTLRGMHHQLPPHAEDKLVRCTTGAVHDVIIDLRPQSLTYLRHFEVELSAANGRALYVPAGFAHGYITLADNSTIFYQMSSFYEPESAGGVRWNDPLFDIRWPVAVKVIHPRDDAYPDYVPAPRGAAGRR